MIMMMEMKMKKKKKMMMMMMTKMVMMIGYRCFHKKRSTDEINCPTPRTPNVNVEKRAASGANGKVFVKNAQISQIISGAVANINIEIGGTGGTRSCVRWLMSVLL